MFLVRHTVRDCTISQRKVFIVEDKDTIIELFALSSLLIEVINREVKMIRPHLRAIRHQRRILFQRMLSYLILQMFQSLMATGERILLQTATVVLQSSDGLKSATNLRFCLIVLVTAHL